MRVKPAAFRILVILRDKRWHCGDEFLDKRYGWRATTYSQRIGELVKAGCNIDRPGPHGDALGRYRLISEPTGAFAITTGPPARPIPTSDCAGAAFSILTSGQVVLPL